MKAPAALPSAIHTHSRSLLGLEGSLDVMGIWIQRTCVWTQVSFSFSSSVTYYRVVPGGRNIV